MATDELVFLHFNDVYHIGQPERIAQFLTQLRKYRKQYTLQQPYTVFSGDVFSPSLEASILTGSHMVPLLNELNIDVGCYGNHDFDFGEARLAQLAQGTSFPWLLSNALRLKRTDVQSCTNDQGRLRYDALLAGALMHHTTIIQGYKFGFFGLAGTDWPSNCRELPECSILSPVETARAVAWHLRVIEACDFVIALTHTRLAEDIEVSEALKRLDDKSRIELLLGGHDHDLLRRYADEMEANDPQIIDASTTNDEVINQTTGMVKDAIGKIRIVKSGTDWKNISCVKLQVSRNADGVAQLHQICLEQVADISKLDHDPAALDASRATIHECLKGVNDHIAALGSQPLLLTRTPLEGTGHIVRSRESNLCNMIADMVRAYYAIDIAFVNAGGIRCDRLIPASTSTTALTVRDIIDIVPFNNAFMVKRISSSVLLESLENSVSDAHTDGRFLHFSGLRIVACWSNPEGSRIFEAWYHPPDGTAPIRVTRSDQKSYEIAMVVFIAEGFDGYSCFKDQETLVGEEGAMTDTEMLLRVLDYSPTGVNVKDRGNDLEEEERIERARAAVSVGRDTETGLPVIAPHAEGRIKFLDRPVDADA